MSNQMAQLQEATIKAQCKVLRMPIGRLAVWQPGRTSDSRKKEPHRVSGALLLAEVEEPNETPLSGGSGRLIFRA